MRVAFVGKGGSGKTTAAALTCRTLLGQGRAVVAIDADINQHLGQSLGLPHDAVTKMPEIGNTLPKLKEILRGSNSRITSADHMVKTTPPGAGSHLIRLDGPDPVLDDFACCVGDLRLLRTGGFKRDDLGQRCFHAKTGAVELILNHLIDEDNQWVIVDMTAGADAFASGLFTRFDLTVIVVEPTHKSLSVWEQYKSYAEGFDVDLVAFGNKVQDAHDRAYLRDHCGQSLIGYLGQSGWVRRAERGAPAPFPDLEPENKEALEGLVTIAAQRRRDWDAYWRWAKHFHIQNAESWANAAAGCDVTQQIDDDFLASLVAAPNQRHFSKTTKLQDLPQSV